jgi:hypothetical protein
MFTCVLFKYLNIFQIIRKGDNGNGFWKLKDHIQKRLNMMYFRIAFYDPD